MVKERENTRLAFRDCIRRGIESGRFRPAMDAEALAAFFSTVLNGLSIQARDGLDGKALNGIVDAAMMALADETGNHPAL